MISQLLLRSRLNWNTHTVWAVDVLDILCVTYHIRSFKENKRKPSTRVAETRPRCKPEQFQSPGCSAGNEGKTVTILLLYFDNGYLNHTNVVELPLWNTCVFKKPVCLSLSVCRHQWHMFVLVQSRPALLARCPLFHKPRTQITQRCKDIFRSDDQI